MTRRALTMPDGVPDPSNQNAGGRIVQITLNERTVLRRSAEVEHERAVAIYDLIEDNRFCPVGVEEASFHLHLAIEESRLQFDVRTTDGTTVGEVALPIAPFRRVVRDYFHVCENYYEAIRNLSPSKIEAIDVGRRALHDEGARILLERLDGQVSMDFPTARRLFTLICVLHIRG